MASLGTFYPEKIKFFSGSNNDPRVPPITTNMSIFYNRQILMSSMLSGQQYSSFNDIH